MYSHEEMNSSNSVDGNILFQSCGGTDGRCLRSANGMETEGLKNTGSISPIVTVTPKVPIVTVTPKVPTAAPGIVIGGNAVPVAIQGPAGPIGATGATGPAGPRGKYLATRYFTL